MEKETLIREGNEGSWKKKGIENRRCIICSKSFKAFNYVRAPRGKRLKEEKIRPFNCVTCSKKCSKLKLDIGTNLLKRNKRIFKEKIQNVHRRLNEEICKKTLEKNEGRTMYFLELTGEECIKIIDRIFREEFGGGLK